MFDVRHNAIELNLICLHTIGYLTKINQEYYGGHSIETEAELDDLELQIQVRVAS